MMEQRLDSWLQPAQSHSPSAPGSELRQIANTSACEDGQNGRMSNSYQKRGLGEVSGRDIEINVALDETRSPSTEAALCLDRSFREE